MSNSKLVEINGPLVGEIEVPGDKSMTHRAIMLGSLATGKSTIYKPLLGEDCLRTVEIFKLLGVQIEVNEDKIEIDSPGYKYFKTPHQVLYTGNSGTTTRLVAGLLCGLGIETVLSGDESIGKRPMDRIMKPLRYMNANITGINDNYTPLIIKPASISGITYEMEVASAQVKSAILFASLFANEPTKIKEFDTTRNHTETMFEHFNIPIAVNNDIIEMPSLGIEHIKPADFHVPGDISSAAYFIVAGLITPGSDITIHNVGINPTRSGIIEIVTQMEGNITLFNQTDNPEPTASIRVQYSPNMKPIHIDGDLVPRAIDEIPIVTTANMLNLLGFTLQPTNDGLIIHPSAFEQTATVNSFTDHRIGMMLAIASLLSNEALPIEQFDAVNVSFPGFLPKLEQLEKEG